MRFLLLSSLLFLITFSNFPQGIDTIKFKWPILPMTTQRNVGGTFGEYRATSANGHYHNGTDISGAAGTPVVSALSGVVAAAYHDGSTGYDSYVRITSNVNGVSKNLTYYHTIPTVSVGQSVAEGQQISTIAVDHIHLIEYRGGSSLTSANQINSLRPEGGIFIYNDPWKPNIRTIKFFTDNSNVQLSPNSLGGKVDIMVHVEEVNGTSSASLNNGTYKIGYKILSADRNTVIFNPPVDGLRYQYWNKAADSYVNVNYYRPESNTSKHTYIVTNGTGAPNVASSQVVTNGFWDVNNHPYGPYTVMIFTEDTRGNKDTAYVNVVTTIQDIIPPSPPELRYIKNISSDSIEVAWIPPQDDDLKGYRTFASVNGTIFSQYNNESTITSAMTSRQYRHTSPNQLFLKMVAVDTVTFAPNLSDSSDTYAFRRAGDNRKILIVDGFDRYGGEGDWNKPYHNFIVKHAEVLNYSFESCSNDEVINGTFSLSDYELVMWVLGDESVEDESFDLIEQAKLASYLENGGKLFVSGSNVAWQLEGDTSATSATAHFLHNYLKAKFVNDNSGIRGVKGVAGSGFDSLLAGFGILSGGSPYFVSSPDVIDTVNGSVPILVYNDNITAAVAYTGSFNNSSSVSQLVYFAFPFETIYPKEKRADVMNSLLKYFNISGPVTVEEDVYIPETFYVKQNYPNPFNPSTTIEFSLPVRGMVKVSVFDLLGKEVELIHNDYLESGIHKINFIPNNLSSGVYFCHIQAGMELRVLKMVYLK
jgi:hypothetical protein